MSFGKGLTLYQTAHFLKTPNVKHLQLLLKMRISVFNSLVNDKILDQSRLKAVADEVINVTQKLKFM